MTQADIETYWPHATPAQKRVIAIYHDFGWSVDLMDEDGLILLRRPDTYETIETLVLSKDGNLIQF